MKFPKFGSSKRLREWEKRLNASTSAAVFEQEAEISFREAQRTGSAVYDAHGRVFKLHAERVRRGLPTVTDLPAAVLRQWDWEGAMATLKAHN